MAGVPLRSVELDRDRVEDAGGFPFSVPAIRELPRLELGAVTLLVGENGTGKSTLLEAVAWAAGLPVTGAAPGAALPEAEVLGRALRLGWRRRSRRGLFLRAEDFFLHVRAVRREAAGLAARAEAVRREAAGEHEGERIRRAAPFEGSAQALRARYGDDPEARSHGEQFLDFFKARLVPGGLHLLDEPEAALSPTSQLALLALGRELVAEGAQLVVATHAPVLMAWPDATILSFDHAPVAPVAWDDIPHVQLLRTFLRDPQAFLRHL
ncbi:MAG: AAA family ATPase [Myxococcota bacterium]|nr:AAA family ATPase [Myxococcota bacterium]